MDGHDRIAGVIFSVKQHQNLVCSMLLTMLLIYSIEFRVQLSIIYFKKFSNGFKFKKLICDDSILSSLDRSSEISPVYFMGIVRGPEVGPVTVSF